MNQKFKGHLNPGMKNIRAFNFFQEEICFHIFQTSGIQSFFLDKGEKGQILQGVLKNQSNYKLWLSSIHLASDLRHTCRWVQYQNHHTHTQNPTPSPGQWHVISRTDLSKRRVWGSPQNTAYS